MKDICPNHAIGVYIIKPQGRCTLAHDEMQGRLAALDDILAFGEMIYQACGLDKQKTVENHGFL